jgi:transcriptional regulator with XRE-family HTH domain
MAQPSFGRRLRQARRAQELSTSVLEARSGVPHSVIEGLETETGTCDAAAVRALAIALGVSADYLLGLTEGPESAPRSQPRSG